MGGMLLRERGWGGPPPLPSEEGNVDDLTILQMRKLSPGKARSLAGRGPQPRLQGLEESGRGVPHVPSELGKTMLGESPGPLSGCPVLDV